MRKLVARCWQWIGGNHEQIKILFAVIAALYVLYEYRLDVDEGKEKKVLEYVSRFGIGELAAARHNLGELWISKDLADWKKEVNPQNYDEKMAKLVRDKGLLKDVRTLEGFYRELALCVEGDVCKAKTVCHFFFDDIQGFRHSYKWYLAEREATWKESSSQLINALAERNCAGEHKAYCEKFKNSPYCLAK